MESTQPPKILDDLVQSQGKNLTKVETITPDASLRRYYRLFFENQAPETMVAMVFDSLSSPEASGQGSCITSDLAYVSLTHHFQGLGVPVPELFAEYPEHRVFFIEDCGSELLGGLLHREEFSNQIPKYFSEAVGIIAKLQANSKAVTDKGVCCYSRAFSAQAYRSEMSEFEEFLLPKYIGETFRPKEVIASFDFLARELGQYNATTVHRDYHPWNLLIDYRGEIRVIDFQDALQGPTPYDLVALLNDRDADAALGDSLYCQLIDDFCASIAGGDEFYEQYDLVLLQRDLKVAGRFSKLANTRGLLTYKLWIPGTLRRIGRTLERVCNHRPYGEHFRPLAYFLCEHVPDVKTGYDRPLRLP